MIIGHLQERTFANWALDPTDAIASAHLDQCEACRREMVEFRRKLATFRESLFAVSESQSLTWTAPAQSEVRRHSFSNVILTWGPRVVLATLLLAFAIVTHRPRPAVAPVSSDASDQALLLSINDDLSRSVPEALAPAEVLVSQTNSRASANQEAEK
jgi:anti-sigma factor RsiW